MGRTIVKEESEDLGEHIRVWDPEDALQLTQRTLGIKAIGGIAVAGAEQNMLVSQNEWLSSMPKLRLLWLDRAKEFYIPSNFPSCITKLWSERSHDETSKQLKVLFLSQARTLERLLDLSNHTYLRRLEFEDCGESAVRIYNTPCGAQGPYGQTWSGAGSRVIVTTRSRQIILHGKASKIYAIERLNDYEGLQVFSWHAFQSPRPKEGYEEISEGSQNLVAVFLFLCKLLENFYVAKNIKSFGNRDVNVRQEINIHCNKHLVEPLSAQTSTKLLRKTILQGQEATTRVHIINDEDKMISGMPRCFASS
eukprot:Gb_29697 [translate_table: standard]